MKKYQSIAAVVVSFNREDYLKKIINSFKKQSRLPDEIIVVFQGDSQSCLDWLNSQEGIYVYHQGNTGSAGGFTKGIELGIERGHDWVFLTDDDAVPALNCFEELSNCPHFDCEKTGLLGSVVLDADGKVYMSPPAKDANDWYKTVLQDKCVPVYLTCWPGTMVSTKAVIDFGLPVAEYFLFDEDFEFTSRIARQRPSYCVITSQIIHYQMPAANMWKSPIRYKNFVRNRFATIRLSGSTPIKKTIKLAMWFLQILSGCLTGKYPLGAITPLFYGLLFFRPKVKYPSISK